METNNNHTVSHFFFLIYDTFLNDKNHTTLNHCVKGIKIFAIFV